MGSRTNYPSETELLSFFGVDPQRTGDEYIYIVAATEQITLRFSFNPVDDTIQTWLGNSLTTLVVVSHEQMTKLWIEGQLLRATCNYGMGRMLLTLTVEPNIKVEWCGLRESS